MTCSTRSKILSILSGQTGKFIPGARDFRRFDLGLETHTGMHTAVIAVRIAVHKDSIGRAQKPAKIFKVS
jgi:hypothetical protein